MRTAWLTNVILLPVLVFSACHHTTTPPEPAAEVAGGSSQRDELKQEVEIKEGKIWKIYCVDNSADKRKECRISPLRGHYLSVSLFQGKGFPYLEVVAFPTAGEKELLLQIDGNKEIPWKNAGNSSATYATIIAQMKAGNQIKVSKTALSGRKQLKQMTLKGFTAAYNYAKDKMSTYNAD